MDTTNNCAEFLKFVGQAIVVIIGWGVVNKLTMHRERDKTRKDIVIKTTDSLCDTVDNLFEMSRNYHSSASRNLEIEIKIKITLQDFALRVASLRDLTGETVPYLECGNDVIAFRQAITSRNFEDEHMEAIALNSEIFQAITASALETKRHLINLKHSQFSI